MSGSFRIARCHQELEGVGKARVSAARWVGLRVPHVSGMAHGILSAPGAV